MKPTPISRDAVILLPADDSALTIGVLPGTDDGIAVAIHVNTGNLGQFVIPVNAAQLGVIVAVGTVLFKLDADKAKRLRAHLVRELEQTEGNQP